MRRPISVAIITLNEERNLRACLDSVRWVDEIVVCDSGSADRTLAVADEYGARTFRDAWRGFAGHKNLAVERCSHPWVLVVDADERVPPALREEIEGVLEESEPCAGYLLPRRSYFLGRWIRGCGWYPDETVRLFRKGCGRFSDRAVHEAVVVDGPVGRLRSPLEHFTYDSVSAFLQRMDRYSALAAEELHRAGKVPHSWDLAGRPVWTFLRMFLLQAGWRDGWRGLVLSGLYAAYSFSKYAKLWELVSKEG